MKKLLLKNALGALLLLFAVNATAQSVIDTPNKEINTKEAAVITPTTNTKATKAFVKEDNINIRELVQPMAKENASGLQMNKIVNIQFEEEAVEKSATPRQVIKSEGLERRTPKGDGTRDHSKVEHYSIFPQ